MKIILAFKHSQKKDTAWYWLLAGRLINWWTKSTYFHSEIAVDNKWIAANTETGIKIVDLKEPMYDKKYDYYELEVPDLTPEQSEIFWEYINAQEGTGYDWIGIYLTQIIKLDWEAKDKWFCSEIVAKVLQMLYVKEFMDLKPNRISPSQIFEIIKNIKGVKRLDMD